MASGGTLCAVLMAVAGGPSGALPCESADVVTVTVSRGSLADGLETFHASVSAKDGWHVVAAPEGDDGDPKRAKPTEWAASLVGYFADGKPAGTSGSYSYPGVRKKDAVGREYPAWEKSGGFTTWVHWDDVKDAKVVSVRVRVVASNGKMRLKPSVVTAEVR